MKNKFKLSKINSISKNWTNVRLSEVVEIISGGTPKTTIADYWGGAIPWLSVVDFNNDLRHVYNTEKSITEKGLANSATNILKKGEIIISARGTVGALAQLGKDMAFNQSCYGIRAKSQASNNFIYYLLKYKVNALLANVHGAVFDTITRQTFDLINIDLPPMPEQQAIVDVLSCLDDKIELNREMNKTLEEIAQALFKRWFVDFEFPNENGEPYKSSGGKMKQSEQGEIPENWQIGKIENCMELAYGKGLPATKRQEGKYPVLGSNGIVGYNSNYLVKGPGIVIGRKGTLGQVHWIENDFFPIDTTFYVIDKLNVNALYFHYFMLKDKEFLKSSSDSAVPGLNRNSAYSNLIIIPERQTIVKFNEACKHLFDQKNTLEIESNNLSKIRDLLLPKLMSGKIRVKING